MLAVDKSAVIRQAFIAHASKRTSSSAPDKPQRAANCLAEVHLVRFDSGQLLVKIMRILIVGAPATPPSDSKIIASGFERNLLCGIADATGRCLGLGIIEGIDLARRTIALTTPVERPRVRIVQFGDTYVTSDGSELGHIKWS